MAEYYNTVIAPEDAIDMVFLSLDLEESDMVNYLKEPKLKCPAVRFDAVEKTKEALAPVYNSDEDGVPVYLVLDRKGTVLSRTLEEPREKIAELVKAAR